MTKSELIAQISEQCNTMNRKQVEFIVNNVFSSIKNALGENDKVEIRGFGSFRTRTKPAKTGRNPRTGAVVNLPEICVPFFRPGKMLKEQLLAKK